MTSNKRTKEQQIDGYIFPSSTINKMRRAIEKTENTNREHGFVLCVDENTNRVYSGPEHTGRKDTSDKPANIKFNSDCNRERSHIGTFHTHVTTDSSQASASDIFNNCKELNKIDCIGSSLDEKIICMTKINPSLSCQDKVKNLMNEEEILLEANSGSSKNLYSELDRVIHENFRITELK